MTNILPKSKNNRLSSDRISDWLLDEGRLLADIDELIRQLGPLLIEVGLPVWRLRLSMRTLHPLIAALSAVWEKDSSEMSQIQVPHGLEGRAVYIGSPLEIMSRTSKPFRKRLAGDLSDTDHTVLHELKARGATDYFGVQLLFSSGTTASLVYVSDQPEGFAEANIDDFLKIASVLAPIAEVFGTRRISRAIAEAYLGERKAQRVLEGQITRGHIETINAAIFASDIRDWTGLNRRLSAQDALACANTYFELVADAIERNGGEILKFMGDGVLAIFPAEAAANAQRACENALVAAHDALGAPKIHAEEMCLSFGIGLHFGEVFYGNIGSPTRLDFTVLGQAVNLTARIEGLCRKLDQTLLTSSHFADLIAEPARLVGQERLKGFQEPVDIFAPVSR